MNVTVAEGVELNVIQRDGDGVPFLLVHGLASNARMWDGVGERLASQGYPSAAVDQRGHGLSSKPDSGYDFTTVTDDLLQLIKSLGFDRPVVAGQSWGGNVVLELAWRFPELVRGIACVDGGTIQLQDRFPDWESCQAAMTPPRTAGLAAADLEVRIRRMHPDWPDSGIAGTMANFEIRADGTVAPWLTLERHLLILRALWEHKPSTRYPEIEVPVLLVPATGGVAGSAKAGGIDAAAAALHKVDVRWFDGDHDIHAQFPVELADVLIDHVVQGFFA